MSMFSNHSISEEFVSCCELSGLEHSSRSIYSLCPVSDDLKNGIDFTEQDCPAIWHIGKNSIILFTEIIKN